MVIQFYENPLSILLQTNAHKILNLNLKGYCNQRDSCSHDGSRQRKFVHLYNDIYIMLGQFSVHYVAVFSSTVVTSLNDWENIRSKNSVYFVMPSTTTNCLNSLHYLCVQSNAFSVVPFLSIIDKTKVVIISSFMIIN